MRRFGPLTLLLSLVAVLLLGSTGRAADIADADGGESHQTADAPPSQLLSTDGTIMANGPPDANLEGVRVYDQRGKQLPLDLTFRDANGRDVTLGDYFDGERPVVLVFGYYKCPMMCPLVLNGVANAVLGIDREPGDGYRIVNISINPNETPEDAQGRKTRVMDQLNAAKDGAWKRADDGWAFLVGPEASSSKAAEAAGFGYKYLPQSGEYSHAAVVVVASPTGMVSRYLYGNEFPARDLTLALYDASDGKTGGVLASILFFCYEYHASDGKYTPIARNLMSLAGAATVVALTCVISAFFILERRRKRRWQNEAATVAL